MKKLLILPLLFIITLATQAQTKQLTIDDAILRGRSTTAPNNLAPENLPGLAWIPGTNSLSWMGSDANGQFLVMYDVVKKVKSAVILAEVNQALKGFTTMFNPGSEVTDLKKFPSSVIWKNATTFQFRQGNKLYSYDFSNKSIRNDNFVPEGAENEDQKLSTGYIAYTVENNLYIKPPVGDAVAITKDEQKCVVNGQAVHRNEFGILKGTFWNNSGNKLAFYKMDECAVTDYSTYEFNTAPSKMHTFKYPMAGQTSHTVHLGVYDVQKNSTLFLETGGPDDQYLTNITWSPDDKYIFIAHVTREQNVMYLKQYDAATGKLERVVFEEKNDRYVEPENGLYFVPGDNEKFVWQSERDGYNHLYLYTTEGKLIRQLTKGNWVVTQFTGFDEKGKNAFYTSTQKSPLDNNAYSVELSSGKVSELTAEPGVHGVIFNSNATYFADNYSNPTTPRKIAVHESKGKLLEEIFTAKNPLADYRLGTTEVFSIKSTDSSTDLYCRVIKPVNFDPTKKYPVLVYLYGGPHLQLIRNNWMSNADLWLNYMAAEMGYVVFSIDNRGSANRGFAFESAVHRRLGTLEMEDQLAGVNWLKGQTYVDQSRMAVFGWSFGGFLTTTLMLRAPGTFKVAVAGGPVIDWKMYEVMYTERYMDVPADNNEGYETANLLNYVQNLKGKLMMIHGTSDDVVLWQHSLSFIKKAVEKGKMMDYFVYPGHLHNVVGPDRVHLFYKITSYIMDYNK